MIILINRKFKIVLILERFEVSWGVSYVSSRCLGDVFRWSWGVFGGVLMWLRRVFGVLGRLAGVLGRLELSWTRIGSCYRFRNGSNSTLFFGAKGLPAVFSNTPRTCRCEFRGLLRMCMCMHVCMHTYVYICKCMYMHIDVCGCMELLVDVCKWMQVYIVVDVYTRM